MGLITEKDNKYVANTYKRFPVEIVSGSGALFYGADGKEYIDMGSGIGVNCFGAADKEWAAAVAEQAATLQHTSNLYYTSPCAELAELLCERTGMKKVFFCNSGAEANECAIKTARKYAQDKKGEEYYTVITLVYNWTGQPQKTQHWVRETMERLYTPTPDGYCGDEDNGQTSAWYVWSALGMYPVCPGSNEFALGAPLFPEATVRLATGKTLHVIANGVSSQNRYVKKLTIDGKEWKSNWIARDKLLKDGATLVFEMCSAKDMP